MSSKDNSHDYIRYFELSLEELGITLPDKLEAAKILLSYYLGQMISSLERAFELMYLIDNEIYKQVDWMQELKLSEKKYVGEELGLEKMFTWYRELQDYEDNGMLLYYNELPRVKQKVKFEQELVEEAKELKSKIYKEIFTHNNV
ncbi:MAG: hypothetical protein COW65_18020 [Cytophagales bacterium CG18_big_fil_WC_8_21_14_2_50_42_9]|nr:MAG: hypothetical protein COW65_18020 [Cytophagales bacterium CG18_big_fil_WC_8_21_14_2_50_42_9]